MGEKTEKATPKKLRDARKKGQVAKSQDFPAVFTFITSFAMILGMIHIIFNNVGGFMIAAFSSVDSDSLLGLIPSLYYQGIYLILLTVVPVLLAVASVGVLINFLMVGPLFTTEVFKFDIKKFNPISNLKAKFKMKTLIELLKQLFKVFVAAILVYLTMYKGIPVLIHAVTMPLESALMLYKEFLFEILFKIGLFFLVVAVADFAYQKHTFAKEMMMEKFEIKQEYKNTEGDPQIKGKRKEIAKEVAYSDSPAQGMKQANAVVTNPIHIAVAIGYDPELDAAPFIATMGEGPLARRIVDLAHEYDIPVLRNIPLAHELYDTGELYNYIPDTTYETVAEIIQWLRKLEEGEDAEYEPEEFT